MSGLKSSGKGNLECLLAWRAMSRSGDKVNRLFQKRVSAWVSGTQCARKYIDGSEIIDCTYCAILTGDHRHRQHHDSQPRRRHQGLRVRAAERGHLMEEEARDILRRVLAEGAPPRDLAAAIRARVAPAARVGLDLPARAPMREPPQFGQGR